MPHAESTLSSAQVLKLVSLLLSSAWLGLLLAERDGTARNDLVLVSILEKERKKEAKLLKGGMGEGHAATTQGF